jgi:hypothetical protein
MLSPTTAFYIDCIVKDCCPRPFVAVTIGSDDNDAVDTAAKVEMTVKIEMTVKVEMTTSWMKNRDRAWPSLDVSPQRSIEVESIFR